MLSPRREGPARPATASGTLVSVPVTAQARGESCEQGQREWAPRGGQGASGRASRVWRRRIETVPTPRLCPSLRFEIQASDSSLAAARAVPSASKGRRRPPGPEAASPRRSSRRTPGVF